MKKRPANFWGDFLDGQALYDGYRPVIPAGGLPFWANPHEKDRENRGPFTAEQILYGLHSEINESLNALQANAEKLKYLENLLSKLDLDIVRIHEEERAEVHELNGDYENDYTPRESAAIDLSIRIRHLIESETENIERKVKILPKPVKLQFDDPSSPPRLHSVLKKHFPTQEDILMSALIGESISEPLIFRMEQVILAELFRRLRYNGVLKSPATKVRDWLCANFLFNDAGELKPVNPNTMYPYLTKEGSVRLSRERRICEVDWAPYDRSKS